MRQPVPQDRLRKYAEIDLSHYEFFDNQHVLEKFPNADPFLIKRLGNANTQRRQYFKYRLLHHERIAKGLEGVGRAVSSISPPQILDSVPKPDYPVPHHTDPVRGNDDMPSRGATNQDTMAKTSTTISIVPKSSVARVLDTIEVESDGGQTTTSFGTIMEAATGNSKVKLLKVPDPPDADRVFAGSAFQCPYCYTLIIVKNSKAWEYVSISPYMCCSRPELISSLMIRRHVFRDLRPYVCTFDSCTKPSRLFETRHDWYDHEVRHHRRGWYCAECAIVFPTSSSFIRHLKEIHPALSVEEQDVPMLADNCERALNTPQQCPLCSTPSEHTGPRLRSHLGRHMQQLALFTLPRLDIRENEGENRSSKAELGRRGSSDKEDKEEMSELEFNSSQSEDEKESQRSGGEVEESVEVRLEDRSGLDKNVSSFDPGEGSGSNDLWTKAYN